MKADEKEVIRKITIAVSMLPDEKRECILWYAEGVIAMGGGPQAGTAKDSA